VVQEDLSLVLEAAKRGAVDDAVAVALERQAKRVLRLGVHAPLTVGAAGSVRSQAFALSAPELIAETVEVHEWLGENAAPYTTPPDGFNERRAGAATDPDSSHVLC
jgi:hypothetical protein